MKQLNIAIIGLGLIGGSLGLAIKHHYGAQVMVAGVDRDAGTLAYALGSGAVDSAGTDSRTAASQADIVFLCTPVLQIVPVVQNIIPCLKPGTILSDVGSTKQYLYEKLSRLLPADIHYVAGHPMAGSEQSGIMAADKDLFRNKCYIIIPETARLASAAEKICRLLSCTGAQITAMELAQHDRCAAVISHAPHVTAAALVHLLGLRPAELGNNLKLAGGGFRDTTRIASSNADMWADICLSNPEAIADSLTHLQGIIGQVIADIRREDRESVHAFFKTAKLRRDSLIQASFCPGACEAE